MSRTNKHAEKMARRRATKAAKAAKYKALAGTSKKTKKIIQRSRKSGDRKYKHAHIMADCGNVGCKRCYPKLQAA